MNTSTHIQSLKKIAQTCLLLEKIIKKTKTHLFCLYFWLGYWGETQLSWDTEAGPAVTHTCWEFVTPFWPVWCCTWIPVGYPAHPVWCQTESALTYSPQHPLLLDSFERLERVHGEWKPSCTSINTIKQWKSSISNKMQL